MTAPSLSDLAAALDELAAKRELVSYGALALKLAIPGPGSINKLTFALESLMREDAAKGRPFRAVLCRAKVGNGLPARGFFDTATRLGRFDGGDAAGFVRDDRAALFNAFGLR